MPEVKQVGGNHYAADYQHWDAMEEADIAYLEGNATAYIRRWPFKETPVEDLEKAISFCLKMGGRPARRRLTPEQLERYIRTNDLESHDRAYLTKLIIGPGMGTPDTIAMAIDHMKGLSKRQKILDKRRVAAAGAGEDPY
jgi:hypothetical protein